MEQNNLDIKKLYMHTILFNLACACIQFTKNNIFAFVNLLTVLLKNEISHSSVVLIVFGGQW